MKIGTLNSYGKRNAQGVYYGFLKALDGSGEMVYINAKAIAPGSMLDRTGHEGHYVAYLERRVGDRVSASWAKLLSEVKPDVLRTLWRSLKGQDQSGELRALVETAPEVLAEEPLSYFLPYLCVPTENRFSEQARMAEAMQKAFQVCCNNMGDEALEAAFGKDLSEYVPYLGHAPRKVDELLKRRIHEGYFEGSAARAIGACVREETISTDRICRVYDCLDLERESVEDLEYLAAQLQEKGEDAADRLIHGKPELLWTSPALCAQAAVRTISPSLNLEQHIQTPEQLEFLERHAGPGVWERILDTFAFPASLLLDSPQIMGHLTERTASALLVQLDWQDKSEENLERWRPLLSSLTMDWPALMMAAVSGAWEQRAALELCWWQRMSESMKVRLLIYMSNFKTDLQAGSAALDAIRQWENGKAPLLCALLRFMSLLDTDNPSQRLRVFLEAHGMLMEYITDCFNREADVTPGLASLLERCWRNMDHCGFCEARLWKHKDRWNNEAEVLDIFCPARRRVCDWEEADLKRTVFRQRLADGREPDYQTQFLMDFLLNLGEFPTLNSIGILERDEYPFRISAYVNSLVQLRTHMKCRFCGGHFQPRFQYAKLKSARMAINRFDCPNHSGTPAHDTGVYLNFCYHCGKIIDSRECRRREQYGGSEGYSQGQYLCMHCGGAQYTQPGTICPNCGTEDRGMLTMRGKSRIICRSCGYDSAHFVSGMETNG